jgi:arginine/lysine/ornithine decarboxylase
MDVHRLQHAASRIVKNSRSRSRIAAPAPPPLPQMAVIPRVAKFSPKRAVPLRDAIGSVSGETVATYPPGAPIIAAGEIVSAEAIEYLRCMVRNGAALRGASDPYFETLKILAC